MKQEEILAMMHNVIANNTHYTTWTVSTPHLVALVNQAVEAEREACARECDDISAKYKWPDDTAEKVASQWCADRIRARNNQ